MREEMFYKVLWVEDDLSIIRGYQITAESKDIELDVATNWEEAEEKLRINFNEYSAIILDAQCKIKKADTVASKLFLGHVSVRISRIFGEKHKFIPWYVLSAKMKKLMVKRSHKKKYCLIILDKSLHQLV